MKTFKHFTDLSSLQAVKQQYKKLAFLHHPDRGGQTATMQEINNEYDYIIAFQAFGFQNDNERKHYNAADELKYKDIINELLNLSGLVIELCGSWLWISGLTYPVKDELKRIGCKFAPKKQCWYWRPDEAGDTYKRSKTLPLDTIRIKYGSTLIEGTPAARMIL